MKNTFLIAFFLLQLTSYSQGVDSVMLEVDHIIEENRFDDALNLLSELKIKSINKTNDYYIELLKKEGNIYLLLSDLNALRVYKEALDIAKENNNKKQEVRLINKLSGAYFSFGELEKAKKYIKKAYEIMIKENFFDTETFLDYTYSKIFNNKHNPDSIIQSLLKLKKRMEPDDYLNLYYINHYISTIYYEKRNPKKALEYLKLNLKYHDKLKRKESINTYGYISTVFLVLKEVDSAYYYNEKVIDSSVTNLKPKVYQLYFENKKRMFYLQNDIKNYRRAELKLDSIQEKYFGAKMKTEIAKIEYNNKMKIKNVEIELLEKNNQIKRIRLITIFSTILLLFVIILFIIIKRNKYKRIINEQKLNLIEEEKKLRSHELISKTAIISKKTNLLNNIISELNKIKKNSKIENKTRIDEIIKEIKIDSNQFWDEFYIYFNDIYDNFFLLIQNKFATITATELRIIAFIKLNYSSKEISKITFTSERTVQKHRQNIRRKMDVDAKTDLTTFIQNLHFN